MQKEKNGFTLIELLGVIIILAVIAVITTPIILNNIKLAKEQALLESAANLVNSVSYKTVNNEDTKLYLIENGQITPEVDISKTVTGNGFIETDKQKNIRIYLTDGNVCAKKDYSDSNVLLLNKPCTEKPGSVVNLDKTGAAIPQIDDSMVPIRYEEDGWVKADQSNSKKEHQWYDYEIGQWANMAVIKKAKKKEYASLPLGSKIDENDVIGYFVGIPSFSYKLTDGVGPRKFDVNFTTTGTTHEAFTWGSEKVTGFWFGKYEVSGSTDEIFVLPNKNILKNTSLTNIYNSVQELNELKKENIYDYKVSEIHLIKNTEWGAVTILSQSKYGVCKNNECSKVEKNNTWVTGYADKNSSYNTTDGLKTSTTGNVYGIYDMNGGSWEFTMATNKISTLTSEIEEPFYNSYTDTKGIKGDLTTEDGTSGWYDSTAQFLTSYQNWFVRGGDVNTSDSSLFWYRGDGSNGGFRNGFRIAYIFH